MTLVALESFAAKLARSLRGRDFTLEKARPLLNGLKTGVWSGKCVAPAELKKTANDKRRDGIGRGKMIGYVLDESVEFRGALRYGVSLNGAGNATRHLNSKKSPATNGAAGVARGT